MTLSCPVFSCIKQEGPSMKFDLGRDLGINFNPTRLPEWTQDFVQEKRIKNGVIITEDSRGNNRKFIKILEVIAINFSIMSDEEQDNTIKKYASLIKTITGDFHIKVITTFSNIDEYVAMARAAYNEEKNESCKNLIAQYIQYLENEGGLDTYRKHYYFIFQLQGEELKGIQSDAEGINIINRKAEEIASGFRSLGNDVLLFTSNEDGKLSEMLYNYYNRETRRYENYNQRVVRIRDDRYKVKELIPDADIPFDLRNLLAPKSIDFNESPSYMVIDGMYRSHFFVRGNTIPNYMLTQGGWLSGIINFGYGYDVDIYFIKDDSSQKLNSIKNTLKWQKYKLINTEAEQENAEEIAENYSGAMWMKQALKGGRESVYDITVLITVWAHTLEELDYRKNEMKKAAITLDVDILECKRYQEEAFYSTGYTMDLRSKLLNVGRRNMTTSAVAAAYPFTAFSLSDKNGIAIGYHRENSSMVLYDPFDSRYANANMSIYGASGHGKSYSLMTLTTRLRYHGVQNFILAPDKQDEFRRICEALGGEFVDIAATSSQRINPLEIRPMSSPVTAYLGGASYSEKSWVIDKIDNLKVWLTYLIPDLTLAEKTQLETILLHLYEEFGMNENNDSIYADEEHTVLKKMPIISDFYEKLKVAADEGRIRRDIVIIMSRFINGACRNMNGETNVDLNNKYIVFGLENIRDEMMAPTMFIILEFIWAKCRQDRTKKKMITIDEGWQLLNGNNKQVGEFVQEIFKVIRGFGGGAIFATQSIVDLFSGRDNYGNAILSCSHSKLILGMENRDLKNIANELGLTQEEAKTIPSQDIGEALFCAGSSHIPIKVKASPSEHQLFTTKREELEKLAMAGMNKQ